MQTPHESRGSFFFSWRAQVFQGCVVQPRNFSSLSLSRLPFPTVEPVALFSKVLAYSILGWSFFFLSFINILFDFFFLLNGEERKDDDLLRWTYGWYSMGGGLYIPAHTWTKGWTRGRTNWVFQGLEGLGGLHSEGRRRITGQVDFNGRCVCAVKKSICPDETVTRQMAKDGMERSRRPVGIEWTSQNFPFFEKWEKTLKHTQEEEEGGNCYFFLYLCDAME